MTQIIRSLSEISANYDALFCDLWGCVHNGLTAYPQAVAALRAYRAAGGIVVLVTNSPRPWRDVRVQLDGLGVPEDAWDAIATSGDSARAAMLEGAVGAKVHFIGDPEHDRGFFAPMDIISDAAQIELVPLDEAEGIVCTGPEDPFADPSVNRPLFQKAIDRGLKLLCANPDVVVDRGETREWCAGALAQLYAQMGGESLYFGKPHPPIYDLARRRLARLAKVEDARILAVGDGLHTDLEGGLGEGLDVLFITGGLVAAETGTGSAEDAQPDAAKLDAVLKQVQMSPSHAIGYLR